MVVCPKCKKPFFERPAISRRDNKTEICPDCGTREAIEDMQKHCGSKKESPAERTRRAVAATGNRWAMENFNATHN